MSGFDDWGSAEPPAVVERKRRSTQAYARARRGTVDYRCKLAQNAAHRETKPTVQIKKILPTQNGQTSALRSLVYSYRPPPDAPESVDVCKIP